MVLSQPSPVSFNPVAPQPIPTAEPKPSPVIPPQLPTALPDQLDLSTSTATKPGANNPSIEKPSKAPAIRFGQEPQKVENSKKEHGWFRKTCATVLSVASGLSLFAAIPLALVQMAIGIIIHPLLITGAITLALPVLGLLGGFLLNKK